MKQSYYGKRRAQGYDIGTDVTEMAKAYVSEWKRLGQPQPLLEPMCGTGLNLEVFQRAGIPCDGLDASEHMLAICRRRLEPYALQSRLYVQQLEEMKLPQQYGMMFIPGGSLGHLYEFPVLEEAIHRIYANLKTGGWFVFDVRPPAYMGQFPKDGEIEFDLDTYDDGAAVFTTGVWQHLESERIIRKWNKLERFVDDILTETEVFDFRERMFEVDEIVPILEQAGFRNIRVNKAYEIGVAPLESDGILFSCHKPAIN